ncbi:MAG: hypothetical protein QXP59_06550 [Saccharolobus sp.]|uniref:hypothetical protein n=1 Tax=Saccharolobus sp. TaxID=2100761 RepID=UPI00316A10A0
MENTSQAPLRKELEGELEKQHVKMYEIGKQLSEMMKQTLTTKTETSNTSLEKVIASNIEDLQDLINNKYLTMLKDHAESFDSYGWIEPDEHLLYLTHIKAGLEIYTMLTKNDIIQVKQKFNELEDEVYKTISLLYALICSKKSNRINTIQKIINKSVKRPVNIAIINMNTMLCKLTDENVNTNDETIKMLISNITNVAKQFKEELAKFKNEKIEITSLDDIVMFIKKISKLLEQNALVAMLSELIYQVDEELYGELDIQFLADDAYRQLLLIIEDLRGENIGRYERYAEICANQEHAKYYTIEDCEYYK